MRIVSWNSSSGEFVRELPLIPMSKADIAVLHRVPKPLDDVEGGLRILWHGSSVELGMAIIVNTARFPQAKTIQVGPGAMVVDLGGPSNLCVLAVDEMLAWLEISSRSPEVPSSASLAITRQQLLKPYAETLASRTCVVLARHEMKAPRPGSPTSERQQVVRHLTERYDLHSAYHCQHFVRPAQELPPLRDSILIPGSWELEGVTCRRLALVVDCQPAKRDVDSIPLLNVGFSLRIGKAVTFHMAIEKQESLLELDAVLNLKALEKSLRVAGVHDIFTCPCGTSCRRCGQKRDRGVDVTLLANGEALWNDHDRALRYRFKREQLCQAMKQLHTRYEAICTEFSLESEGALRIAPYQSGLFIQHLKDGDSMPTAGLCLTPSQSAFAALHYFPELPDNELYEELLSFHRWIDNERLYPLGTRFVPFAQTLLQALPEITALPALERLVLILAAASAQSPVATTGFPKIRSLLGNIDTVWNPLLRARDPDPFNSQNYPSVPEVRLPLLGALLHFGECVTVVEHRPYSPIPRVLFEPEELLVESEVPGEPAQIEETEFDRAGLMEFWKRAYTDELTREADGSLHIAFTIPEETAEQYLHKLVEPRVTELNELLELIREGFSENGLRVGELRYSVTRCARCPRMPLSDEALFEMDLEPYQFSWIVETP